MQQSHALQFDCRECKQPITFSLFSLAETRYSCTCSHCNKKYLFSDPSLQRQLRLFENLCRQLVASEEILSLSSIGVDVGERRIEIPYRLLLTRLQSNLSLTLDGVPLSISFRIEPARELVFDEKGKLSSPS